MSMYKIYHIYRKYETLNEIANKYSVDVNDIIYDNMLNVFKLKDFSTIIINLHSKEPKRGD